MTEQPSFKIGIMSDWHAGFSARCRTDPATGLNARVRDGYKAGQDTITQMIEAEVDMVLNNGDTFHSSWPTITDIVNVRAQLNRLHHAEIPVVGNTGNHDASNERSKSPATAVIDDPDRDIHFVTEPYELVEPVPGLLIHVLSHYGLARAERLVFAPVDGTVNILSSHGAAMIPGHEVFRCVDSPGEQTIGLDLLLDPGYALKSLGHYHGMDEILPTVWYSGSAIRRGFSDPAGGRGWLLANVMSDGSIQIERKYIDQRPQYDLPHIDAAGLSGAEVQELIQMHLSAVDLGDAIVRQVVTNCPTATRRGIDHVAIGKLTKDTLMWMPAYSRPETTVTDQLIDGPSTSLMTAGSANLPLVFRDWVTDAVADLGVTEDLIPVVKEHGERHLTAVAAETDAVSEFIADDLPGSGIPVPAAAAAFALAATKVPVPAIGNFSVHEGEYLDVGDADLTDLADLADLPDLADLVEPDHDGPPPPDDGYHDDHDPRDPLDQDTPQLVPF
ncbi:metallophosphoesterase family protein [Tessaracoccus sp.]